MYTNDYNDYVPPALDYSFPSTGYVGTGYYWDNFLTLGGYLTDYCEYVAVGASQGLYYHDRAALLSLTATAGPGKYKCPDLNNQFNYTGNTQYNYAINGKTFGIWNGQFAPYWHKLGRVQNPSTRCLLTEPAWGYEAYYNVEVIGAPTSGVIFTQVRHSNGSIINVLYCDGHAGSITPNSLSNVIGTDTWGWGQDPNFFGASSTYPQSN